tara:strand:+ start:342 stop:833 length:492 start_codon:yes stop_codon:yes gene_type:complete
MLHDRAYVNIVKTPSGFEAECVDGKVRVVVLDEEKLSVKALRGMMTSDVQWKLIIVCLLGPTSFTRREIQEKRYNVDTFVTSDLVVNVSRHAYTPRIRKLSTEEATSLFHSLGTADGSCLPRMLRADPVCRYYDFQKGDVVHISRVSGYQELGDYYRMVTDVS